MNESETLAKDRKTVRAALALVPMNAITRELVLGMVDRHFDSMTRLAARVAELEQIQRDTFYIPLTGPISKTGGNNGG